MKNNSGCLFVLALMCSSFGFFFGTFFTEDGYIMGFILAIIGIVFAFALDSVIYPKKSYSKLIDRKVLEAVTKLSMLVIKADDGISNSELYAFRDYMFENFGSEATADAIYIMQEVQYKKISSTKTATVINSKLNYSEKMQILQFLFKLATSDGELHSCESDILSQIANDMQILQTDFLYLKKSYNYMYNRRYSQQDSSKKSSSYVRKTDPQENDYALLGVKNSAGNEEIKAAYRRLVIANHPDKVFHLGETAHKEAEKRFSKINEAYNRIKKARKI